MSYKKFEALLKQKDLKPADVSKETGIATSTLTNWKQGKYTPKSDKLQKIADFLDVPITYFYDEDSMNLKHIELFSGIGGLKNALTPNSMCIYFVDEPEIHMHSKTAYELVKEIAKMKDTDVGLLLGMAKRLTNNVVPFPQYPTVTDKDIDEFAARNAKKKFTREEIAEMLHEMKQEDK